MRIAPLVLALLLASGPLAHASVVDDICSPPGAAQGSKPCACTASPARCRVTGVANVTSPSTLDFGARSLEVAPGGRIVAVTGGILTVLADAVELQTSKNGASSLQAPGGSIDVQTGGDIAVRRTGGNIGRIVAGSGGITLSSSGGNVVVEGALQTATTPALPDVGDIDLSALGITVSGDLDVRNAVDDSAGTIALSATGDIVFQSGARILGTGISQGAEVDIAADGDVTSAAAFDLQGNGSGETEGLGGELTVSGLTVALGGAVDLRGTSVNGMIGEAGALDVYADGNLAVSGSIDQSGPPAGKGGDSSFESGFGNVTFTGSLNCSAAGTQGHGGQVLVEAARILTLGKITCTGGSNGTIAAFSNLVDAGAKCDLRVPAGVTIDTRGPLGSNTLRSGAAITVAGKLQSTANTIFFGATPPVIAAGALSPSSPGARFDATLKPCPPLPACGNGVPEGIEACDDGNAVNGDGCDTNCTLSACGNGIKAGAEGCDDGNTLSGDGCDENCTLTACGNGVRTGSEECDDGAQNGPTATCSATCTLNAPQGCGNGTPDPGEQCDDGNQNDCDGCSTACIVTGCGNGSVEEACGEECDGTPDCSATCTRSTCGDGRRDADRGEECDAGPQNGQPGSGCSETCLEVRCGNGRPDAGEACDDGNQQECDGCDAICRIEARSCPLCTPSSIDACVPCAGTVDCNPLRACGDAACVAGVCTPVTPPNCDDGNACTSDTCDPTIGCVSTPVDCGDDTACDGLATCDPATGTCRTGAAADCDDGDECSDDSCGEGPAGARCDNVLRVGLAGATCRLAALQRLIESPDVAQATRKKLRRQSNAIAKRLPTAAGTGKRAVKAKTQVTNRLKTLAKTIARARKKSPSDALASLDGAVTRMAAAVSGL